MSSRKTTNQVLLVIVVLVTSAACVLAEGEKGSDLGISALFSDNMVLQSGKSTPVWGWSKPGTTVTVTITGKTATAKAGEDGKWIAYLKNLKYSSDPLTMTVSTIGKTVTFKNVLIGDVWVGSGQSNMGVDFSYALNQKAESAAANYPNIRLFSMPQGGKVVPGNEISLNGGWSVCTPDTAPGFSAVMYFFGREVHLRSGRPIGLIQSRNGGTRIEWWMPADAMANVPEYKSSYDHYTDFVASKLQEMDKWSAGTRKALAEGRPVPTTPIWPEPYDDMAGCLFNGMISPLIPCAISGVLWYQGESNADEGDSYFSKQKALIETWRKLWGRGDFPFYYVQLPNYGEPNSKPEGADGWAQFREAQTKTLSVPNTRMAVTIDIGQGNNLHPPDKQDVGKRLALLALHDVCGQKDLVFSGPLYRSMKVDGGTIRISFDYVGHGLMVGSKVPLEPTKEVRDGKLKYFAIAGADKVWHWADAKIEGKQVVVSSPDVPAPVAVRYAFSTDPEGCNLYNKDGLPASPFRTDDWPQAKWKLTY